MKVSHEQISREKVHTVPLLQTLNQACGSKLPKTRSIDRAGAKHSSSHDQVIALSNAGLATGTAVQKRGGRYFCDRGSTHISHQNGLLLEEYQQYGLKFDGIDPRTIANEVREYQQADGVLVPSRWVKQTFEEQAVPADKVHVLPYGVELSRFYPDPEIKSDGFEVVFVGNGSVRKGLKYLFEAFEGVTAADKRLTMVGGLDPALDGYVKDWSSKIPIRRTGNLPRERVRDVLAQSHVLFLPSIEEGLALVQGQALACGCPAISTRNSGAEDLFEDGQEGFIVEGRDVPTMVDRLNHLASDRTLLERMRSRALERVQKIGGWDGYGDKLATVLGLHGYNPSV
jgi:glycosyltransferase involved in cell wall biosynthesis